MVVVQCQLRQSQIYSHFFPPTHQCKYFQLKHRFVQGTKRSMYLHTQVCIDTCFRDWVCKSYILDQKVSKTASKTDSPFIENKKCLKCQKVQIEHRIFFRFIVRQLLQYKIEVLLYRYTQLSILNCYWSAEKQHKLIAQRVTKASLTQLQY